MQTRVVSYKEDRYLQHFLNGKWATICQTDLPMSTETATTLASGSQNEHARLSPSDAKRWLRCTAAIGFEKANEDKIFEMDVNSVIKLTPYLKSLPPEELFPHEGRAMRWARDVREGRVKAADLTPEQKKDIRKSEGNQYSREGTRAHEFATQIFAGEKTLEDIPEEFRQPVGYYIDFCKDHLKHEAEPFFVETKVPLFYDTRSTGTRDFAIIRDDRVVIIDYKHGQGELVDAVENPQCTIYGLSTIEDLEDTGIYSFDPDTIVEIWIVQPRHHADKPAKQWEVSLADLRGFRDQIQATHDQIVAGDNLEFHPSEETCKWCKCKAFCPARAEAAAAMLTGPDFEGIDLLADLPDIDEIPGTTTKKEFNSRPPADRVDARLVGAEWPLAVDDGILVKLFRAKSAIEDFLGDVKDYLTERVLAGEKLDGLKIVMGRQGDREWTDEEAAEKYLKNRLKSDDLYIKKLIGPAKAEGLIDLKKEKPRFVNGFNALITRSSARKTVADIDDKRAAVASDVSDFPDIEDENEFPEGM